MAKELKKKQTGSAVVLDDNLRVTEILRKEREAQSVEELKAQIVKLKAELKQAQSA